MMKFLRNKKAALPSVGGFYANWPEILTFLFLIAGFILAVTAKSAVMSYIIIFCCGTLGGRLWYQYRNDLKVALSLILVGFLIGFLLGNFYGSVVVTIISYLFGIVISYQLHIKGTLK